MNNTGIRNKILDYIENKNKWKEKQHEEPPNNKFYASKALQCPRKLYLDRKQPVEFTIKDLQNLYMRQAMHKAIQSAIGGKQEIRKEIKQNGILTTGYIDNLVKTVRVSNEIPVEVKTIRSINYVRKHPKIENIAQLCLYMKPLNVELGAIVYADINTGEIIEHPTRYSDEIFEETMLQFATVRDHLNDGKPPEKREMYTKSKAPCSYCKHKHYCYNTIL